MESTKMFDEITDNALIKVILDNYTPLMKAEHKGVKYSALSKQQQYQYETGYRAGQILNQLERVEQATILVSCYPYIKTWRKQYGQFEFFQYNMEAYYLSIAGLSDRMLILTNQICCLGLKDKDAKMTPVIKKLKSEQRTHIATLFETLKAATAKTKSMRNDVTHAERFHEKDLWHIAILEFSLRNKTVNDPDGYLKADLDWDVKYYRKQKKEQLKVSNDALIPMVKELFEALHPVYLEKS